MGKGGQKRTETCVRTKSMVPREEGKVNKKDKTFIFNHCDAKLQRALGELSRIVVF